VLVISYNSHRIFILSCTYLQPSRYFIHTVSSVSKVWVFVMLWNWGYFWTFFNIWHLKLSIWINKINHWLVMIFYGILAWYKLALGVLLNLDNSPSKTMKRWCRNTLSYLSLLEIKKIRTYFMSYLKLQLGIFLIWEIFFFFLLPLCILKTLDATFKICEYWSWLNPLFVCCISINYY